MKATITSASTDSVIETEVGFLLKHVSPSKESELRRRGLVNHIQGLFDAHCYDFKLALGGSYPLQVYLPESDMDVTVLTPDSENNDELTTVMQIFSCLCQAIKDNEKQNALPFAVDDAEFKIQSIEFINARIKVVTCLINRMSLDITANQRNSLATATFLEEANRLIGHNGLFKQGIILVKVWCLQESAKYNNLKVSISGSKEGMFSSYALSILVLYLFNLVPGQLTTPLQVLRAFLETFSTFQFDKYVLTLDGPIPIQNGGSTVAPSKSTEQHMENRFRSLAERVHASLRCRKQTKEKAAYMSDFGSFRLRTCNIVDPVDPVNNLGVSVTWKNFWCFKSTLTTGLQHLNDSLLYMESSLVKVTPPTPSPTSVLSDSSMPPPPPTTTTSTTNNNNSTQLLTNTNTTNNINTSPSPPPPSTQRKPLINMGGLSGAVTGIAPGLIFPSTSTSSSTTSASASVSTTIGTPNPSTTSPTIVPSEPSELDILSPCSSSAGGNNMSMSPPNNVNTLPNTNNGNSNNNNPPSMLIAPSMSTSPGITGIAAGGAISRVSSNGNSVIAPSPSPVPPVSTPLLPTNTIALATEYRFLKRFFPNCVTCYQLEKTRISLSQVDASNSHGNSNNNTSGGMGSGHGGNNSSHGSSNGSYLSKLARSTSPFRDPSLGLSSHRGDRSHSMSCSSQQMTQTQSRLQSRPQSQPQVQLQVNGKGTQPSRTISDTACGSSTGGDTAAGGGGMGMSVGMGVSGQPVSFLGGATIPKRMRSQSYTSLQSTGGEPGRAKSTSCVGGPEDRCDEADNMISEPLQGDLAAMWEALNYNYDAHKSSNKKEVKSHTHTQFKDQNKVAGPRVRDGLREGHCDETDTSDTLTSVDDSSPPIIPKDKEISIEPSPFSSLDNSSHPQLNTHSADSRVEEGGDGCQREPEHATEDGERAVPVRLLSPRATAGIGRPLVDQAPTVTHPTMPPLIKKMPPLTVNNPVPKQQNNTFSLFESPINRKVASENNSQAMNSQQNNRINHAQSNNNNSSSTNTNTSKSKRKKGKSKDLLDSSDVGSKGKQKKQAQVTDPDIRADTSRPNHTSNTEDVSPDRNTPPHEDNNNAAVQHWKHIMVGMLVVTTLGLAILFFRGWLSPVQRPPPMEMRSAYMKAHQNHAYQGTNTGHAGGTHSPSSTDSRRDTGSRSKSKNRSPLDSDMMGSGFGKKVHSSPAIRNPLEKRGELDEEGVPDAMGGGGGGDGNKEEDDERNMSAMYDSAIPFDTNASATSMNEGENRRGEGVVPPSHSTFLEDADDLVHIAEMWLVKGQNVTLGLSHKAQEAYQRYMASIKNRLLAAPGEDPVATTKHEGIWFKDSTPLIHSNSSLYLKVTNMNVNTTGIYTFAIVKQKIRKGFSARPSGKVMRTLDAQGRLTSSSSAPPSSATAVASVNGDVSILDAKIDPASFEVIRVMARTVLRLGAVPSSRTKPLHLVLTTGSQLYLHIEEEGSPAPSIQWFKNGVALRKERKNVLIVNDVNKSHEGTYTCALINMAGKYMWLEATVLINEY